jgi:hypothetical protein
MLRPVMIATGRPVTSTLSAISAATPTAPEPSATSPCRWTRVAHRRADLRLGHRHQGVGVLGDERRRDAAGFDVAGEAVGQGRPIGTLDHPAGRDRGGHRLGSLGLDPDDPDVGLARRPQADPGHQPTTADRHDEGQRSVDLLAHLGAEAGRRLR